MASIAELAKEKGINLYSKKEWKDSPTTPRYTDFSKLDLKKVEASKAITVTGLDTATKYDGLFEEEDPMIRINHELHNFSSNLSISGDKKIVFSHNSSVIGSIIINMEKDSNVSIDLGKYDLFNILLKIITAPGSKNRLELKSENSGVTYIRIGHVLAEGSELELVNSHIKDSFLFLKSYSELSEKSSLMSRINVYADNGAHYDCVQDVIHIGRESNSHIIGRGVIDGPSVLIFRGILKMSKEKCSGNFETKTLNISKGDAFTDSVPTLDISSNNVSAKHSSSIENIDKEQLFYLTSRGFDEKEASKLIISSILALDI
ncbi:MAG: SufD family Fe-S cluster assembly protein [Candidatus Parvarchaeota archaeon]|nr:SufD family Fe-S cluster assembly protein [Candidatus Parvarchaeota archaeon]